MESNQLHTVREMNFGLRQEFIYMECSRCGCLTLVDVPENLSDHYPSEYWLSHSPLGSGLPAFKAWRLREASKGWLGRRTIAGALLAARYRKPPELFEWAREARLNRSSAILDVGCGTGDILHQFAAYGFSNLLGVDPFIQQGGQQADGVRLLKTSVYEVKGQFDFIMFHHSFEHMPDPRSVLTETRRLLKPRGQVLIRTPVASSYAWQKYGVNWAQIDAPRHLYVHTPASIRILAQAAGFRISNVTFDSTEFQFWASEQYYRDVPLRERPESSVQPNAICFPSQDMEEFRRAAADLNARGEGDQACFYLVSHGESER